MKKIQRLILITLILGLFTVQASHADDADARHIMQLVEDREQGDQSMADVGLVLIDQRGNQRTRMVKSFSKEMGDDRYSISFFLEPADIKGTASLTYDYDAADQDDDQWLYMPALGKVKRLTSADQSGSYMGTDLNYSDLTTNDVEDYEYTLLKEDEADGVKVWVIQAIPRAQAVRDETGYSKSVMFIRQDNYMMARTVRWVEGSQDIKYFDVKRMEEIDGIWVVTEMHVTTKRGKQIEHKTIITRQNVRFDQSLDDDLFTVRQLEKGVN